MRIAYGIAGVGLGHAVRARTLIDALSDHEFIVYTSGDAYSFLQRLDPIRIKSGSMIYHNNELKLFRTFFWNVLLFPALCFSLGKVLLSFASHKPDIIISDFEPLTAIAGRLFGKKVIAVDNIHALTHTRIPLLHGKGERLSRLVTRYITPANKFFIPAFFPATPKDENVFLFPPIVREEILQQKVKKGKHILVYQRPENTENLLSLLNKFPHQFIVYGLESGKRGNVLCKPISPTTFIADLVNARAVITAGGFSLITEALSLRKPVLAVPIEKHYEQLVNASLLASQGYGMAARKLDEETLTLFFSKIEEYKTNLNHYQKQTNNALLTALRSEL